MGKIYFTAAAVRQREQYNTGRVNGARIGGDSMHTLTRLGLTPEQHSMRPENIREANS